MKRPSLATLSRLLLATFVGAITTLAFAPFSHWYLAILSPFALLLIINRQSTKVASWIGFFWGLGQFGTGIQWVQVSMKSFGGMPAIATFSLMFLLVSYLSIYPALFAGLLNRFFPELNRRRFLIAAPILWLISDWLRGWVMTGFPWLWLGYSQIDSPLSAFAPLSGVELITLMMWVIAGAFGYLIVTKKWIYSAIPLSIFAIAFLLGQVNWVTVDPTTSTKFALLQGNIKQEIKWHPNYLWPTITKYTDMSRQNWDADIVIWPEGAIPAFESELTPFITELDKTARENDSSLITGLVSRNAVGQFYNSVITLGKNEAGSYDYFANNRYSKHHLLPFGEFVPFANILRPLAPFFNLPQSSFTAGDYIQPNLESNGRHLLLALCYEIIFSQQVRENVTPDTDFILTLSNDAWFGESIGPLQHMEIARMRALELGKPVVRTTNNGVTAITDHKGKIVKEVPQFNTETLRATVSSTSGDTPYRTLGPYLLYLWSALGLGGCWLYRRRTNR